MRKRHSSLQIVASRLLKQIERTGWTEEKARRFEKEFGERIRWSIVLNMERLGLLQGRVSPNRIDSLSNRRLQLYENTLSDLWIELFNGLLTRYLRGIEEGRIHQEPMPYISGVVRRLTISNARELGLMRSETPREMIVSFCEAKRETTKHARLAWIKFCLGQQTRQQLLSQCPSPSFETVYKRIHHIVDYFFEVFLASQCERLADLDGKVVHELVALFHQSGQAEEAMTYVGKVTPYAVQEVATTGVPDDADEDEYLSALDRAASGGWR